MNDDAPRAIRGCLYSFASTVATAIAAILCLSAAMLLGIVLWGTCTRAASAEPDVLGSETSRTARVRSTGPPATGRRLHHPRPR